MYQPVMQEYVPVSDLATAACAFQTEPNSAHTDVVHVQTVSAQVVPPDTSTTPVTDSGSMSGVALVSSAA